MLENRQEKAEIIQSGQPGAYVVTQQPLFKLISVTPV